MLGGLHGQQHRLRTTVGQIDGDLGTRVARTDHQHPTAHEQIRVAIRRRVHEFTREHAGPVGHERNIALPRRDHDSLSLELATRGLDQPARTAVIDPLHLDPRPHVERMPLGVPLQIRQHALPRRPLPERTRHPMSRQAREPTNGVQMQPVVARYPSRAHGSALDHDDTLPHPLQHRSTRQPRRPRPSHHDHLHGSTRQGDEPSSTPRARPRGQEAPPRLELGSTADEPPLATSCSLYAPRLVCLPLTP